ncbi:hypothetical protein L218DRAFT_949050 [Marasmius fiardii PR-910]|nr:hypothetical protein L218DRAFT_949050 [Marasmius fiardii PR-910]
MTRSDGGKGEKQAHRTLWQACRKARHACPAFHTAYRFHLALVPPKGQDLSSDYRLVSVIMKADVKDCRTFVAHLAQCRVTPAEVEACYAWAVKYCLDIQHLTFSKRICADTSSYVSSYSPTALTYLVPQHWKLDEIYANLSSDAPSSGIAAMHIDAAPAQSSDQFNQGSK